MLVLGRYINDRITLRCKHPNAPKSYEFEIVLLVVDAVGRIKIGIDAPIETVEIVRDNAIKRSPW
jgi:hypothetical protein